MINLLKEHYYSYLLSPVAIISVILFILILFMVMKFSTIMFNLMLLRKDEVANKTVNIQAALITLFIISAITILSKVYEYNTNGKFLVDGKNNLVYTVATLENIEQEKLSKGNIIREYRGEFNFSINGKIYYIKAVIPKDYNKYVYFVKINMDNTKHYEILPMLYKELLNPNMEIPYSGWKTNPIPSLNINYN